MAIKILAYNSKGGVGKTTTIWAIGSCLAAIGLNTLITDIDFQGHQATAFGLEQEDSLGAYLNGQISFDEAIVNARPNLDLIRTDFAINEVWDSFPSEIIRYKFALIEHRYQYILFDSNPGMNRLTRSAAEFVDYIIAPVNLEFLAIKGVGTLQKVLDKEFDKKFLGVIPCKHDLRTKRTLEILDVLKEIFKDKLSPPVRVNNDIDKAQNLGLTLMEHDPLCNGAQDYLEVTRWVIQNVKQKKN